MPFAGMVKKHCPLRSQDVAGLHIHICKSLGGNPICQPHKNSKAKDSCYWDGDLHPHMCRLIAVHPNKCRNVCGGFYRDHEKNHGDRSKKKGLSGLIAAFVKSGEEYQIECGLQDKPETIPCNGRV